MRLRIGMALLFLAAVAVAQQPYFESLDVQLHNLDVLVTDAQGNPVRGLKKEDFIVFEDGKEQEITNFSAYDLLAERETHDAPSPTSIAEETGEELVAAPPRRFVFFVDDMSIRRPVRRVLIENATKLLEQLQPGDLAAVVRPIGTNRMPQPFTADIDAVRTVLAREIESCTLRFTRLQEYLREREKADGQLDVRYTQRAYVEGENDRIRQRLSQLRALIASMAGIEGRKVLMILTDGLPAIPGRLVTSQLDQMHFGVDRQVTDWNQGGDFTPLIEELGRLAAANGVTIYSIEPQVPLEMGLAGDRASSRAHRIDQPLLSDAQKRAEPIVPPDPLGDLLHNRALTLRALAERTGGDWTRGVPRIDDHFRQITSDLSAYYSLAYRARGVTGKPRRVRVSVRHRPEWKVRTRSEVIERAPEREMGDLVASTLLFPRDVNELRMKLETGTLQRGKRTIYVPLDIVVPLETLTFLRSESGKYSAAVDIHFATSGFDNPAFTSGHQRQTFEITDAQFADRKGMNYRFKTGVEVWPGKTRIAIGAMDAASRMVGFRTTDVESP